MGYDEKLLEIENSSVKRALKDLFHIRTSEDSDFICVTASQDHDTFSHLEFVTALKWVQFIGLERRGQPFALFITEWDLNHS